LISENEEYISKTIDESLIDVEKRKEASRYQRYLKLHMELLCKHDMAQVINFVKKDYYPIKECLDVCIKYKADQGVAWLQKRNGDYL
jgi:hypothetical protein